MGGGGLIRIQVWRPHGRHFTAPGGLLYEPFSSGIMRLSKARFSGKPTGKSQDGEWEGPPRVVGGAMGVGGGRRWSCTWAKPLASRGSRGKVKGLCGDIHVSNVPAPARTSDGNIKDTNIFPSDVNQRIHVTIT